jgi:pimeloyl-ACP methyl ester carboxylesterase
MSNISDAPAPSRSPACSLAPTASGLADANGIQISYETFGDPNHPAILLVMGFTAQLNGWPLEFCSMLVDRGHYVVRFDNRDCGLSTHLDGIRVDLRAVVEAWETGGPVPPIPYTLSDFSDDAFGLLTSLGIERAHIIGASMGGMIVQTMAIEQPERVLTMTSIMSTTGEREFYQWNAQARTAISATLPADREGAIAHSISLSKILGSPRHWDEARATERATTSYDRAFYPEGAARQTAAIRGSGDRAEGLRNLKVPTLVIHGQADPLILPIGGQRTAELVPGANLLLLSDMGHDLPQPLWPLIVDTIISHTTNAI